VEGADLVVAGIRRGYRPQTVFVLEGASPAEDLPRAGTFTGLSVAVVTRRVAERITTLETPPDISAMFPLLAAPPLAELAAPQCLVVYADRLADPGNLGTLLRAAAAFGASALITSPDSADHLAPKVVRASMGAVFALPVYAELPLAEVLASLGEVSTYGLAAHGGADLRSADLRRPAVICVGAERAGLSPQTAALADVLLTIPLAGGVPGFAPAGPGTGSAQPVPAATHDEAADAVASEGVESLNAGVAGAIALYEFACRTGVVPTPATGGAAPVGAGDAPASLARTHPHQTKR
jgi:RNA methyltransferase, TrmH family